jgi:hypothetical protein
VVSPWEKHLVEERAAVQRWNKVLEGQYFSSWEFLGELYIEIV